MIAASNIFICDLPIRMDNYSGCSHNCSYCFAKKRNDISKIKGVDMSKALRDFISGYRANAVKIFDYKIPLHWGGMSDPFQPIEREKRLSDKLLDIFIETQYPFVVSTKGEAVFDYIEKLKKCNCVVQFSAVCPRYDQYEPNAMPFNKRLEVMALLSPYKRVIARVQPYQPFVLNDVLESVSKFADAGIYGLIFEGMKYQNAKKGTIRFAGDNVYPVKILLEHFMKIKAKANDLGLKVFAGENRLRQYGDSLCCCGIEGMGWQYHTANLNHYLFDRKNAKITPACKKPCKGLSIFQKTAFSKFCDTKSFEQLLDIVKFDKSYVEQLLPIK